MKSLNDPDDSQPVSPNEQGIEWHSLDITDWINVQVAHDPALQAMQATMAHAAKANLDNFEIFLAGEVAEQAALGINERTWLNTALRGDNKLLQGALRGEGIMHFDERGRVRFEQAIANLKLHGCWPW